MPDTFDTMGYNRNEGAPWHGKGEPVEGLMTGGECIRKAHLDWGVAYGNIPSDSGDSRC